MGKRSFVGAALVVMTPCGAWAQDATGSNQSPPAVPAPAAAEAQQSSPSQAPAQTEGPTPSTGGLEDIVVTAQKRSENLQNVPIAVTAVTSSALEKAGVSSISDLTVAVPGLNATNTYGRLTLSLRGIGSTSVGPGVENPIALYIDGVYYASTAASLLSLNNISQIEVLKGPQGTLFGRNATGGLVQVTTKDPGQQPEGSFDFTYGNYNTAIGTAYISGGLANNLAADIAVYAKHQGDGWGKDLVTGKDVYSVAHDIAVRSKMVFTPSGDTKFTLIGDYNNTRDTMVQSALRPGSYTIFTTGPQPDTGYNVRSNYVLPHTIESGGASLRWDQQLGDLKFSSITAYRQSSSTVGGDIDATEQEQAHFYFTQVDKQFSQELQLSSDSSSKLKWTVGAFFFDARSGYRPIDIALAFAGIQVYSPSANERIRSIAGYGQATYPILQDTNLTLGIRYTNERHTLYDTSFAIFPVNAPLSAAQPVASPSTQSTDNQPTWRASIDHRFSPEVLVYASYNRGFKAGGFNVSSPGAPAYSPERLDAYEVGMKTNLFDRRVRFNVAGFYYNYDNIQVQRYNAVSIETVNGAKAQSYGFDADLTAILARGLQLTSGITVVHPTFKSFPGCVVSAPNGGVPLFGGDCTGYDLPTAPRTTVNAALDYVFAFAGGKLDLNGNVYYNSGFFTDIANNIHQDKYAKLGLSVQWTDARDRLSIRAFGNNLTNKRVYLYGDSQGTGTMIVNYSEPRVYGLTLGYKY